MLSAVSIVIPTQVYLGQGLLHFPAKPVSVEGCTQMYNVSQEFINSVKIPEETLWPMGPTRQVTAKYQFLAREVLLLRILLVIQSSVLLTLPIKRQRL